MIDTIACFPAKMASSFTIAEIRGPCLSRAISCAAINLAAITLSRNIATPLHHRRSFIHSSPFVSSFRFSVYCAPTVHQTPATPRSTSLPYTRLLSRLNSLHFNDLAWRFNSSLCRASCADTTDCVYHHGLPTARTRPPQSPHHLRPRRYPHSTGLRNKLWLLSMGAFFRRASETLGD